MTYEPRDMAVTGFGGNNLNLKRFEENGKRLHIDGDRINAWDKLEKTSQMYPKFTKAYSVLCKLIL